MRKSYYRFFMVAAWLLLPLTISAQRLAEKGFSADNLVPEGWTSQVTEGDLNKDGQTDLLMIALPNDEKGLLRRDDGYVHNLNQPILAVYFGIPGQGFVLWRQYDNVLPADEEYMFYDFSIDITPKGSFIITIQSFASAGSWSQGNDSFTFRFQQGDFFMIGKDEDSYSRNTGEGEKVSYNYLTHKCQRTKYNVFDDKVKPVEKWSRIPAEPLTRLGEKELL